MRHTIGFWQVALTLVLCLMLFTSPAYAAVDAYMQIEGSKQGQFKGEAKRKGSDKWIPVLSFSETVESPRDAATGQASGKRQHKPIKITKEVGAASPQLLRALNTGEVLRSVVIEFVRPDPKGREEVYRTVRLENALVGGIQKNGKTERETEQISLTYQKIEVTNANGKNPGVRRSAQQALAP
jgi:type VI secretion system secreted protein Hcp